MRCCETYKLYGLQQYSGVIDHILHSLGTQKDAYDIRLILTELLSNAYYHGNHQDNEKPIILKYVYDGSSIKFVVRDCGAGFDMEALGEGIPGGDILSDGGRGIYLIRCVADEVKCRHNVWVVKKVLHTRNII